LVGDHRQLPPYLDQKTEEELRAEGIDPKTARVSLFEDLFERMPATNRATLARQFRMHRSIGAFVSDLYYADVNEGRGLEHGTPDVERTLELSAFNCDDRVFWIDVQGRERQQDTTWWNQEEVDAVAKLLESIESDLRARGEKELRDVRYSCGVIAGYVAQRERLRDRIVPRTNQWRHLELTDRRGRPQVATVDAFQGKQRDIIIYSMVRVRDSMRWVSDPRRLNVAFSRARRLLVIVGSAEAAARSEGLARVLNRVAKANVMTMKEALR
jgi:superfamily I DNA and/or RNA helicase